MKTKYGVFYRCFIIDGDLQNRYTELLFDRSIDEDTIEQFAINKLELTGGHLDHYEEELVELNKYGQLYVTNLFVPMSNVEIEPLIVSTSLKITQDEFIKIAELIGWLTSDTIAGHITSLGYSGFLRISNHNSPPPKKQKILSYLDMRILSAITQRNFTSHNSLAEALKGGSSRDQEIKIDRLSSLSLEGFIEEIGGVLRLTQLGADTLGDFAVPLDLDSKVIKDKNDEISIKDYPTQSGIPDLTPTADTIMSVMLTEKQLAKHQLKRILTKIRIYNLYGAISKAIDKLVKDGILLKQEDIPFNEIDEDSIISLNDASPLIIKLIQKRTEPVSVELSLVLLNENPNAFMSEIARQYRDTTPEKERSLKSRMKHLQNKLQEFAITIDEDKLTEIVRKNNAGDLLKAEIHK